MKEEDDIEKLFKQIEGQFDVLEPSNTHKKRFLEKLQEHNDLVSLQPRKTNWVKPFAIAASIVILFGIISLNTTLHTVEAADLGSVSEQMENTQNFFTNAITAQLEEINENASIETNELVKDAMTQLDQLESDYETLKKDLFQSNKDKRVISAMITNFQKRASLLQEVLEKINKVNTLKFKKNEDNIL